jgi:cytochrome c5
MIFKNFANSVICMTVMTLSGMLMAGMAIAQRPPSPAELAALPAGEGKDVVAQQCSLCHALGLSIGKPYTAAEWNGVLKAMVARGAQISGDAQMKISTFTLILTRHYSVVEL